ncbi:efflux transporter outer membrane subunit [Salinimicrobium xinjiangense]|uniref:efflux transporter outer membrane subunit n=1 Tax=Salinimicrobium xinjiangense TaxID=438596 RepID=UPI000410331B|nr:efflux transporter outer membrane subunit [Salinimicrobium xinjiangense]
MILLFTVFPSCTPKLSPVEIPVEEPQNFSNSGEDLLPDKWWTSFNDPVLDSLVKKGLEENLSLAGNLEAYYAALARVQRENSSLFPQVDVFSGITSRKAQTDFSEDFEYRTGFSASYEIDLWGRIRAGIQAEKYTADAIFRDYQAAAMTISAEIATTWYQLVTARRQLELIDEQIQTNEDIVKLIRARFAGGQIRAVDILRQEQLLESTRNQKIIYETDLGILENRLAILLGRPPQNIENFEQGILPPLPSPPATGLPMELVRRRPDIQRDYNLLLAADRDMAFAVRSKFPVISLEATGQFRAGNFDNLFENWAYTLAGNLFTPLFYGGRLSAEVDHARAVKNQRLYEYGQTVLLAFQEVENSLLRERKQAERLVVLERQLDLAQKTSRQLRISFLNGMSNYLDVLLALDQQQQLERELLERKQEQLEIRIGLYRALAGAFELPENNSL